MQSSNASETLTPSEVEEIIGGLNDKITVYAAESYILVRCIHQSNDTVIGASFRRNYQSETILTSNQADVVNSNISAAAIFNPNSLFDATIIKILLIDNPFDYQHSTDLANEILVSPVIVTNVQGNNSLYNRMNVSLFFQFKNASNTQVGNFTCVYYDINSSSWSNSGCTTPIYNSTYNRYECFCIDMSQSSIEFSSSSGKKTSIFSNYNR